MSENLIPLSYEEALSAMVVDGAKLVDGKNHFIDRHYKFDGWRITTDNDYKYGTDEYEWHYNDTPETIIEFPDFFSLEPLNNQKTLVHKAVEFAAIKHGKDTRKGKDTPYIYHPLTAFNLLRKNNCSENVLIAGLLHDTLEDTETTPEEILNTFGQKILDIVKAESEDKSKTWKERKQATIDHLENASLEVKLVCCADKVANLNEMATDQAVSEIIRHDFWGRFNATKAEIEWYYTEIAKKLKNLSNYKLYDELLEYIDITFNTRYSKRYNDGKINI